MYLGGRQSSASALNSTALIRAARHSVTRFLNKHLLALPVLVKTIQKHVAQYEKTWKRLAAKAQEIEPEIQWLLQRVRRWQAAMKEFFPYDLTAALL